MNKKLKIMLFSAATLLLAAGCDDNDKPYDPGIEFSRTGEVSLIASIENCVSRASLVATGEARWLRDDAIGVVCNDGSVATLPLNGTGDTRRAIFTGNIPSGKTMGDYAVHPSTVSLADGTLSFELPAEIPAASTGDCSIMVAEINNSTNIAFRQLMSYVNLQLSNVSTDAVKIVISSDQSLSGSYSVKLDDVMATGIPARDGNETLTLLLPDKKTSTVTATFAVPTGSYTRLTATAVDANGKDLTSVECLTADIAADRARIRSLSAVMPKVVLTKPKIEGTVLVAGIYWAVGNLQYSEGNTTAGFQTNWRIAPNQWHYVNCEKAKTADTKVDFKPKSYTPDYDHFNWGGIAKPFDKDEMSSVVTAVGTDIGGKMFLSQDCTVETTDFSKAVYGDLAFWASNGKFRMPSPADIKKLTDEANIQYASYKLGEGSVITGLYFTDPAEGEARTVSTDLVEITDEDMENGLFLPKAGRRYNGTEYTVNVQGAQGVYWISEAITNSAFDKPCYGGVLSIQSKAHTYPYYNKAFNSTAGFCIRPVYIEK